MNTAALNTLANKLAHDALVALIRLCPEIRTASEARKEAVCAGMRTVSKDTIDQLIDDAADAPGVSHIAYQTAVLNIAHAGIKTLRSA